MSKDTCRAEWQETNILKAGRCDRKIFAQGYCQGHYVRVRSGKPVNLPLATRIRDTKLEGATIPPAVYEFMNNYAKNHFDGDLSKMQRQFWVDWYDGMTKIQKAG